MSDEFDDEDVESGVYSFKDLQVRGIVKDRSDLHRKQKKHGFPRMFKTAERQAAVFRRPVHRWLKKRANQSPPQNSSARRAFGRGKRTGPSKSPERTP